MKAIILAGGMARRLKPITNDLPKCLLSVGGETIIGRQIRSLVKEGIGGIVVVTGFKSELLEQHLTLHHPNDPITIVKNERFESTGPAYGLWCAREYLGKEDILYLNGDLVCDHVVIRDIMQNRRRNITAISRNIWDKEQVKVEINPDRSTKALGKWIDADDAYGEFVGATKISKEFGQLLRQVLETLHKERVLDNKFAADALHQTLSLVDSGIMYIQDVTNYKTIEIDTIADFRTADKMWQDKMLKKIITLIKIVGARIVHALSHLFPRSRHKLVFLGWHKNDKREVFADNSKYLFLNAHNHHRLDLRPIWIAQDNSLAQILEKKGFEAHYTYSLLGIWHALTSGWTIVDAHMYRWNWQFSGRSRVIQLWHGKGMKKSGLVQKGGIGSSRLAVPELFQKFKFLIASSKYTARLMADIFKVKEDNVLISGLPRNDALFGSEPGVEIDIDTEYAEAIANFKKEGAKKIIAYMPTFRRNSSNPLDQIDLETMNRVLGEINSRMIITLHPKFASMRYDTSKTFKNIKVLGAGYDVYPLLKDLDMLITDYGSIYVDYLLLDRPLIFYTYDRESYEKETGLYEDFDDLTPGPHVRTAGELVTTITSYDDSLWKERRREVTNKLHTFKDGRASSRILQEIAERFKLGKLSK